MSRTLDRLREDHRRMRNVLAVTRQFTSEFEPYEREVQADHLFCLLDYLTGYPDKVHHPTEDAVFDCLMSQELSSDETVAVQRNRSQHRHLQKETREIASLFNELSENFNVDRLNAALDEYCDQQLEHMAFEERVVFPLALEKIPQASWSKLDEQFAQSMDPLFDQADKSYSALYRHLLSDPEAGNDDSMSDALLRYLNASLIGRA